MVFSSVTFLYLFLPVFCLFYFATRDIKYKNIVICVFSAIFYALGEPTYIFLLFFNVFINFIFANAIEKRKQAKLSAKKVLIIAIVVNVLIIFIFKYLNLFCDLLNINIKRIPLPIGISFYTFQSISYVVDVYRGDSIAQKKYQDLFLYIACFPQLIAGPIVRYKDIEEKINNRESSIENIYDGIIRIVIGLSKKIIISNNIAVVADSLLKLNASYMSKAIGILVFICQLYFDFSGYSDIAIGLGKIIGFEYKENFNYPLISKSQTEFFRRWHISLSTFFRDYVYIPLGGNKKNQYANIFIVWLLTGIWHGATINFVLWGLFLAFIIIFEKAIYSILRIEMPIIIGNVYFILTSIISFAIFYFDDIDGLKQFFNFSGMELIDAETKIILSNNAFLLLVAIIFAMPVINIYKRFVNECLTNNKFLYNARYIVEMTVCIVLMIACLIFLVSETNNPFLYFRF